MLGTILYDLHDLCIRHVCGVKLVTRFARRTSILVFHYVSLNLLIG